MPLDRKLVDDDTKLKATEKWLYESQSHMNVMTEEEIMTNLSMCYKCLKVTQQRIKFLVQQKQNISPHRITPNSFHYTQAKEVKLPKTAKKEEIVNRWIQSQNALKANPSRAVKSAYILKSLEKKKLNTRNQQAQINKEAKVKINVSNGTNIRPTIKRNKSNEVPKKIRKIKIKSQAQSYIKIIATNRLPLEKRVSKTTTKVEETQKSCCDQPSEHNEGPPTDLVNFSSNAPGLHETEQPEASIGNFTTTLLLKTPNLSKASTDNFAFSPTFKFGTEPLYSICGGNGNHIIEEILKEYGWIKSKEKNDGNFKLKWSELRSSINFSIFREGEQMVNHIPNSEALTNKHGLIRSIKEYGKIMSGINRNVKLDFLPESYGLDDPREREKLLTVYREEDIWICKPTKLNQGKGIFLVRNQEDFQRAITSDPMHNPSRFKPLNRIVQRYISNPLLIENRKFDIRCYMLIATTLPFLVLYHKGYVRLSISQYDKESNNMVTHLTNQYIQKKDPRYAANREDTIWSMERFNEYFNKHLAFHYKITKNWVLETLTKKMQSITKSCFNAVKNKLERKLGYFELFGLDFLIDNDLKVWMIEINTNPSMATNCSVLKAIVPGLLRDTLDVCIECFEKGRRKKTFMPLTNLKNFEVIFSPYINQSTQNRSRNVSQVSSKGHRRSSQSPFVGEKVLTDFEDEKKIAKFNVGSDLERVKKDKEIHEKKTMEFLGHYGVKEGYVTKDSIDSTQK